MRRSLLGGGAKDPPESPLPRAIEADVESIQCEDAKAFLQFQNIWYMDSIALDSTIHAFRWGVAREVISGRQTGDAEIHRFGNGKHREKSQGADSGAPGDESLPWERGDPRRRKPTQKGLAAEMSNLVRRST
jgi:hypothetical protein